MREIIDYDAIDRVRVAANWMELGHDSVIAASTVMRWLIDSFNSQFTVCYQTTQ